MITKLTPEQKVQLEIYAKKWREIGLSTEPANRPEAEKGVRLAYELLRLKPPQKIIWCDSPARLWEKYDNTLSGRPIGDSIWHKIADVVDIMMDFIDFNLFQQIDDDIDSHIVDIWELILLELRSLNIKTNNVGLRHGQHDALYHAVEDYCSMILEDNFRSKGLDIITQNAGWWIPCINICYISERHNILNLDNQDRPHCDNALAIGYPDGWGVYAWHGVRVPEYVIMRPQDITPDKIMSEANAEVARVMLERYGQDNFIRDGGFTIQQSDDYGDLYRVEFDNGDEPIVAVKVKIADTDQEQFLYVPYYVRTAREGVAWFFGYDNLDDYSADKET